MGGAYEEGAGVAESLFSEYDPTTNMWAKKLDMLTARTELTANVANGSIFIIGGRNKYSVGFPNFLVNATEQFDPSINMWITKTPIPTPRYGLLSAAVDSKIYVIGGRNINVIALDVVEMYDPLTDIWPTKAKKPIPGGGTACVLDKKFMLLAKAGWNYMIQLMIHGQF